MNPIYYNENQITSGYTKGTELVDSNGEEYVGAYHRFPNDTFWKGYRPVDNKQQLFRKPEFLPDNEMIRLYKKTVPSKLTNYIEPVPYRPILTNEDYSNGSFERYFIQKTNRSTIMEIDLNQYQSINRVNRVGIDGLYWRGWFIKWDLNKATAPFNNEKAVKDASHILELLPLFINNFIEFSL